MSWKTVYSSVVTGASAAITTISYAADAEQMWRLGEMSTKSLSSSRNERLMSTFSSDTSCQTHVHPWSTASVGPSGTLVALPLTSNADRKIELLLLTTLLWGHEDWVLECSSCLLMIWPHAQSQALKVLWPWSCGRALLRTQLSKQYLPQPPLAFQSTCKTPPPQKQKNNRRFRGILEAQSWIQAQQITFHKC